MKIVKVRSIRWSLFLLCFTVHLTKAETLSLDEIFNLKQDGSLEYIPDVDGNTLPDFSYAGFKANNEPIPQLAVTRSITAVDGDNTKHLQAAINRLVSDFKKVNGFHGVLLLKAGEYRVAGQLKLPSGVVIRGEGRGPGGTKIIATGKDQRSLIVARGELELNLDEAGRQRITDSYVPVGVASFTVKDASSFKVGDDILLVRFATKEWIASLGMDKLPQRADGREIKQWLPRKYDLKYEREIKAIYGNTIEVDVPLVQMIDEHFGGGAIYPIKAEGRVSHVGVENMLIVSEYKKWRIDSDEDHAWIAIEYKDVENAWITDVTAKHFAKSLASIEYGSRLITVRDTLNLDPASKIKGRRRYAYALGGAQTLFLRCDARNGRHDYITYSKVPGPNAFVYGVATKTHSDIGPHMRWATGTLYDNIEGGDFNAEDRGNFGSGHGWSGAQQVFWNTKGKGKTAVQSPPGAINWSIGHVGKRSKGRLKRSQGRWSSHGKHVQPESLFVQQLIDRMGAEHAELILKKREYN